MVNKSKAKGTAFETAIVKYLRGNVAQSVPVFKPRQEGFKDVGDVHVGEDIVIQAKDHATWSKQSLYDWVDAARLQAGHAKRAWPVAVVKRRKGAKSSGSIDSAVVAMSLDTFAEMVNDLASVADMRAELEDMVERLGADYDEY